jgi:hypothetical protein
MKVIAGLFKNKLISIKILSIILVILVLTVSCLGNVNGSLPVNNDPINIAEEREAKYRRAITADTIPQDFTWSDINGHNYMGPREQSQGNCRCCWAFAYVQVLQAMMKIEMDRPNWWPDLSEQHLVSCAVEDGCEPHGFPFGFPVMFEHCFLWQGTDVPCDYQYLDGYYTSECDRSEKFSGGSGLVTDYYGYAYPLGWQKAILEHGPLIASISLGNGNYHAVTITGWFDEPNAPGGAVWAGVNEPFYDNDFVDYPYFLQTRFEPYHKVFLDDPLGGETLYSSQDYEIKWSAENYVGNLSLNFSTDGGETYQNIANVTGSDESYIWDVPRIDSENCTIMIEGVNDDNFHVYIPWDESTNFTIVDDGGDDDDDDDEDPPTLFEMLLKIILAILEKIFGKSTA